MPKQGFGRNFFNFRAKHQQGFGRNLYQPSGETLNDFRSSLVLRMLMQMYCELFWCCGHAVSHRRTCILVLPRPSCYHNTTHTTHTFYPTRPP